MLEVFFVQEADLSVAELRCRIAWGVGQQTCVVGTAYDLARMTQGCKELLDTARDEDKLFNAAGSP